MNQKHIAAIRSLKASSNFKTYREVLDELARIHTENLLAARDDHSKSFYQGFVLGLRKARDLADELVTKADADHERKDRREDERTKSRAQRLRDAIYGTPFWSRR